jgi:ribonuclease HI
MAGETLSNSLNETQTKRAVELYTDGACSGNPGPGGWAYILRDGPTKKERKASGGEADTTNNRMELMAVIEGLRALQKPCKVTLHADSQYVLNGLKSWMAGWKRNGWRRKTSSGYEPLKNVDLWKALDELKHQHDIQVKHVKGHAGHAENEECDQMAVAAAAKFR